MFHVFKKLLLTAMLFLSSFAFSAPLPLDVSIDVQDSAVTYTTDATMVALDVTMDTTSVAVLDTGVATLADTILNQAGMPFAAIEVGNPKSKGVNYWHIRDRYDTLLLNPIPNYVRSLPMSRPMLS
jgi:hypothetical protein